MVDQKSASGNRVVRWLRVVSALAPQDRELLHLAGTPDYRVVLNRVLPISPSLVTSPQGSIVRPVFVFALDFGSGRP
jgi:hypothetical protein